ncbi:MAG: hypothetical protein B7Z20_04035 [Sphingobium sp. 32-64-5]|nr:MAG: hypothetical protein B7Z20_04035 [Sphingobium sp. 32-64-5]
MFVFLIALSASSAEPALAMKQPISSANAVKRVLDCGIAYNDVQVRYVSDLQDDVIKIAPKSPLSDQQYECVANTSYETGYYVDFEPPFREKYWRVFNDLQQSRNAAEARERLKIRGILDKVPHFDGNNLLVVAEKIETICGITPPSIFILSGENVTLRPERLADITKHSEFTCFMDGMSVAGVQVGFVGNDVTPTSATETSELKPQ